jgi:hypothetical protein
VQRGYTFGELPRPVQVQLAGIGPLLLGGVVGFLLGETTAGYWAVTGLGLIGGIGGGLEHVTLRAAGARGLVAGTLFGTGIVAAHAAAGDRVLATAPKPLALLILFSAVGGTVLALIGFWLRRLGPTG